jgi:hypothetical protein
MLRVYIFYKKQMVQIVASLFIFVFYMLPTGFITGIK